MSLAEIVKSARLVFHLLNLVFQSPLKYMALVGTSTVSLGLEVYHLLDNGYATPEDIDRVTKVSFGLRIPILGLVKRLDYAGLELVQRILRNKAYYPPKVRGRSETVDELVDRVRSIVEAV